MPLRLAPVMAAVLTAAVLLAGCGGGVKKAAPDDWVADVCTAAKRLSDQRAATLLVFFNVDSEDGQAMYEGFNQYSTAYGKALETFEAEAKIAGEPDIDSGDRVRKALEEWVRQERSANDSARKAVAALDKNGANLAAEVDDLFFGIQFADLRKLLQTNGGPGAGGIIQAIEKDSHCAFALFAD